MGWVVYNSRDGEIRRYYVSERSARSQTKSHNTKAIMKSLRHGDQMEQWSCLEWSKYEQEFIRYYTARKPYILTNTAHL